MDLQLAERAFFVTGGSRGIGKAICELLLAEGASVSTCSRNGEGLNAAWADLTDQTRRRFSLAQVDVLDASSLVEVLHQTAERFGRLDGVVANAGVGIAGGVLDTPLLSWTDQFEVKIHSVLNVVRPVVSLLSNSDAGRVVIINGTTAWRPDPEFAAVSAARAAVLNLSRSLATTLAAYSICVNTVNLGPIVTDRQRERYARSGKTLAFEDWCNQAARRRGVLLGRMGRPAEVAPVVALLLSPLSSYLTGAAIDVSGGGG